MSGRLHANHIAVRTRTCNPVFQGSRRRATAGGGWRQRQALPWDWRRVLCTCLVAALMMSRVTEGYAAGIAVGSGLQVLPGVLVTNSSDDNIHRAATTPSSSMVTIVTPGVMTLLRHSPHHLSILWSASAGSYADSPDDDYLDQRVVGVLQLSPTRKTRLQVKSTWLDTHEARGTGFSEGAPLVIAEPDEFRQLDVQSMFTLGSKSSRGRLEITGDYQKKEYVNHRATTAQRDYVAVEGRGTMYVKFGARSSLMGFGSLRETTYDTLHPSGISLDGSLVELGGGLTWLGTARSTGYVKGGVRERTFSDAARTGSTDVFWDATFSFSPRTYSVWELSTGRESRETAGFGDSIDQITGRIKWDHEWGPRLDTRVSYSTKMSDYVGAVTPREDDFQEARVGLEFWLLSCLSFGLEATHESRDSTDPLYSYERNVVIATVKGQFCPPSTIGQGSGERWAW